MNLTYWNDNNVVVLKNNKTQSITLGHGQEHWDMVEANQGAEQIVGYPFTKSGNIVQGNIQIC